MNFQHPEERSGGAAIARIKGEAAVHVSWLLQQEFGLSASDITAELHGSILTIRLCRALTPIGRLVAQAEGGTQLLQKTYEIMRHACEDRLHMQIALVVGFPICQSMIDVDAEDVFLRVSLCLPPSDTKSLPAAAARPSQKQRP